MLDGFGTRRRYFFVRVVSNPIPSFRPAFSVWKRNNTNVLSLSPLLHDGMSPLPRALPLRAAVWSGEGLSSLLQRRPLLVWRPSSRVGGRDDPSSQRLLLEGEGGEDARVPVRVVLLPLLSSLGGEGVQTERRLAALVRLLHLSSLRPGGGSGSGRLHRSLLLRLASSQAPPPASPLLHPT